jgi:predicted enzyme related to lactoylglutathione lyase
MQMETGLGIRRIGQIAVPVRDVARAAAFYRDVLGLRHLFDASGMSFFQCGEVRLMLAVPETGEQDRPSSIIYLDVPDIGRAYELLRENGAELDREPTQVADLGDRVLWLASFRDTEQNLLALMSEVPKSG